LSFGYGAVGIFYNRNVPDFCDVATVRKICYESELTIDSFGKEEFYVDGCQICVHGINFIVNPKTK